MTDPSSELEAAVKKASLMPIQAFILITIADSESGTMFYTQSRGMPDEQVSWVLAKESESLWDKAMQVFPLGMRVRWQEQLVYWLGLPSWDSDVKGEDDDA